MAISMNAQRKEFRIVLGVDFCKFELSSALSRLSGDFGINYFAIKHFSDDDTQYVHYHLVLCSKRILRAKQVLNIVCDCFGCDAVNVQIMDCFNIVASVQYLIHKNNPEKHLYTIEEVFTNEPLQLASLMNEPLDSFIVSSSSLLDVVVALDCNIFDIIKTIGICNYNTYRNTIRDIIRFLNAKEDFRY